MTIGEQYNYRRLHAYIIIIYSAGDLQWTPDHYILSLVTAKCLLLVMFSDRCLYRVIITIIKKFSLHVVVSVQ